MSTARREVTTRIRGLYLLVDSEVGGRDPERYAALALESGVRLLQLRCKGWAAEEVLRLTRSVVPRCRAVGATLLVNDHPEVAVAGDADGVHVGQLDGATEHIRRLLGEDRILGRSTHDVQQLERACRDADYVAFGPIWSTEHAGRPKGVRGPESLALARMKVPDRPLVAIGGITPERLPLVRAAGIDSWAVIGAVALASDPRAAIGLLA